MRVSVRTSWRLPRRPLQRNEDDNKNTKLTEKVEKAMAKVAEKIDKGEGQGQEEARRTQEGTRSIERPQGPEGLLQ